MPLTSAYWPVPFASVIQSVMVMLLRPRVKWGADDRDSTCAWKSSARTDPLRRRASLRSRQASVACTRDWWRLRMTESHPSSRNHFCQCGACGGLGLRSWCPGVLLLAAVLPRLRHLSLPIGDGRVAIAGLNCELSRALAGVAADEALPVKVEEAPMWAGQLVEVVLSE